MTDRLLRWLLLACALIAGGIVLLIAVFLVAEAWPALAGIGPGRFVGDADWQPAADLWNLLPMVWGSLFAAAGALLLAVPIGLACAIFLRFHAPVALTAPFRGAVGGRTLFSQLRLMFLHIWAIILVIRMIIWATRMISSIILIILDSCTSLVSFGSTIHYSWTPVPRDLVLVLGGDMHITGSLVESWAGLKLFS